MMTIEETTRLYATVLRQLLPTGGYDTAPNTTIAADILVHAKALAQCDLDAKRLLNTLSSIPLELISEYEAEFGLPLKCNAITTPNIEERLNILSWIKETQNVFNLSYLKTILTLFGLTLLKITTYKPIQCTTPCNLSVNTEQLRYKVKLKLNANTDLSCIAEHYLPAYLKIELES